MRRLRFVRAAKDAGFILDEIAELLGLDASDDRARARAMAQARIAHLDEEIARLERARDALHKLARECAGSDTGPCPIIAAFEEGSVAVK
ncbi:MerR family DNA-binding protein [Novosphingobium resinovorum]